MGDMEATDAGVGTSGGYALSTRDVVVEAFPDETVAVNLATGRYYSLDLATVAVFELVTAGHSVGDIAAHLAAAHGADPATVESDVAAFVQQLLDQELVVAADSGAPRGPLPAPTASAASATPYRAPTLAVYSDMEDLLLLDPIHDVDETGWPVRADLPAGEPGPRSPDPSRPNSPRPNSSRGA